MFKERAIRVTAITAASAALGFVIYKAPELHSDTAMPEASPVAHTATHHVEAHDMALVPSKPNETERAIIAGLVALAVAGAWTLLSESDAFEPKDIFHPYYDRAL